MSNTWKAEEIITCESYKGLCDSVYKVGDQPKSGVIHVNMEELLHFFEYARSVPEEHFVVVSSCSDFGVCEQQHCPVWADAGKWMSMTASPEINYKTIRFDPRCDMSRCRESDRYSVKCYSYTAYTFNEIPPNVVRWFLTNSGIFQYEDNRLEIMPFGVAANSQELILRVLEETQNVKREPLMYVNWVNYTFERAMIKSIYRNLKYPDVTIVEEAKPYEYFLKDLRSHLLVMAPQGNGIDCYRTLESVYMGAVPILEAHPTTIAQGELPVIIARTLYNLQPRDLIWPANEVLRTRSTEKATLSYWRTRFENARALL